MTDLLKLYYTPGLCSLAPHIVLAYMAEKKGIKYEIEKVDIGTHKTEKGEDFYTINNRGAIPALAVPGTSKPAILTQNGAILMHLGDQSGISHLSPRPGSLDRARLHEALSFCSDLHVAIGRLFHEFCCSDEKKAALAKAHKRLGELERWLPSNKRFWLSGDFSQADLYLAVIISWCITLKIDLSAYPKARKIMKEVFSLPAAQTALKAEGLSVADYTK